MPTTGSIVHPSLLLKSTLAAGEKTNVGSKDKAGQKTDSSVLLRPKKQKKFQLADFKFAREDYFKGNKFFKLERGNNHANGVLGALAPYVVSNDNVIAAILLGCFVMVMVASSLSRNSMERQIKSFFRISRSKELTIEANEEMRLQTILIAQTSLLESILYYLFARNLGDSRLPNDTQLGAIGCFFGVFVVYFLFKYLVYGFVDWVFLDRKNNGQWRQTQVFLSSLEGILLFPIALLLVYFSLSLHIALIYTLIVMLCVKVPAFYKSYSTFFKRMGASLQIILYFCALELVPLIVSQGVLLITDNYLIINFQDTMIKKILVSQPRPSSDKSPYYDIVGDLGVELAFRPLFKMEGLSAKEFRQQGINLLDYTVVVFTSHHVVDDYFNLTKEVRITVPEDMKYFYVIETIALYIQKYAQYRKYEVFFGNTGEIGSLIPAMTKHEIEKYLVPQSSVHTEALSELLDASKLKRKECVMYRTVSNGLAEEEVKNFNYDMLVFFSPTEVRTPKENIPNFEQGDIEIAAFGPATTKEIGAQGLRLDLQAPSQEYPSMTGALRVFLEKEKRNK